MKEKSVRRHFQRVYLSMLGKGSSNLVVSTVEIVTGWFNLQNSS